MQRRSTRLSNNNNNNNPILSSAPNKKQPSSSLLASESKKRRVKKEDQEESKILTQTKIEIQKNNNNKSLKIKKSTDSTSSPPLNWKTVFDRIKLYRQTHEAVVDTMGCACLAEPNVPPKQQRFQTLVSLMLSSQTKDTVTSVAIRTLQKELPGGLCINSILEVDESTLDQYIYSVGFHSKKVKYIKQTAAILREKYDDDIPDTIEGLTSLPGVGPKMGYLTLQVAWKKNLGIGVDVHVHRISNRLGWVRTEKGGPEDTRLSLQSWLPKEHWQEINPMLVGFGQIICFPRGPKCVECPVNDLCPASTVKRKIKKEITIKKETNGMKKKQVDQGEEAPPGVEAGTNEVNIKLETVEQQPSEIDDRIKIKKEEDLKDLEW
ncbi:DNA glycosylase [Cunninghamella echinulata]|nr:DNA glycosylase [Cunninghamella echinulata]